MAALTTVICVYRVVSGREAAFTDLLKRHWPTLRSLDLVTDEPPRHYKGNEQGGGPLFVEIFDWKDEAAARVAHEHPDVMAIWEPMDKLTERRDGRPNMEFPHVAPLSVLD
jgi:hypothetical protein